MSLFSTLGNSNSDFEAFDSVFDPNNNNQYQHSRNYFTESTLNSSFNLNDSSMFSFVHMNIRSLPKHFNEMINYFDTLHPSFSVVGLSETWLKQSNMPFNIYSIPGFHLETNCRVGRVGGGVALYVSTDLQYCIRQELTHSTASFESIFIEIKNSNCKNIIVGVIYKPPSASFNDSMTTCQQFLDLVASENRLCLISGDFSPKNL